MQVTCDDREALTVIAIRGELVAEHAERLRHALVERIDRNVRDFVIDLAEAPFVDSRGFETLLWLQDECVERLGQVRLAACREDVLKALEITRLSGRLECEPDVAAAVASLGCTT